MRTRRADGTLRLDPLAPRAVGQVPPHLDIRALPGVVIAPRHAVPAAVRCRHRRRHGRLPREFPVEPALALREPEAHPDEALDDAEDQDGADGDAEDVRGGDAGPLGLDVEEGVGVEPLRVVRHVREGQVQREHEDDPPGVDPGRGRGARDDDLEEGEGGVEGVLGGVGEGLEGGGEPHARVDDAPVDGGDDEGVGGDGGVVEGVQGLQRAGELLEHGGGAGARVGQGVEGRDEVVEGQPPVGEDGEVRKLVARGGAAAGRGVGALPADLEEVDEDAVDALLWVWLVRCSRVDDGVQVYACMYVSTGSGSSDMQGTVVLGGCFFMFLV